MPLVCVLVFKIYYIIITNLPLNVSQRSSIQTSHQYFQFRLCSCPSYCRCNLFFSSTKGIRKRNGTSFSHSLFRSSFRISEASIFGLFWLPRYIFDRFLFFDWNVGEQKINKKKEENSFISIPRTTILYTNTHTHIIRHYCVNVLFCRGSVIKMTRPNERRDNRHIILFLLFY